MNEYEFVHLSHPQQKLTVADRVAKEAAGNACRCKRSLPELEDYMQSIVDVVAYDSSCDPEVSSIMATTPTLCQSCVDKLEMACDVSMDKIKSDIDVYNEFFMRFQHEGNSEVLPKEVNDDIEQEEIQNRDAIAKSYVEELHNLIRALAVHSEELSYLNNLILEQESRTQVICQLNENVYTEMNSLEIDSNNLQYDLENCARKLSLALDEVEHSNENVHLSLFEIVMDERPLINGLRLAHRPKGNLKWQEINAAWAEAVKLLLFCGGTLEFTSAQFRVAPLTSCAKIIQITKEKHVHNLGREFESSAAADKAGKELDRNMLQSIRVFVVLMSQLFCHLKTEDRYRSRDISPPPFSITQKSIGNIYIMNLKENDDKNWLALVFAIASNLKWLVENIGLLEMQLRTSCSRRWK